MRKRNTVLGKWLFCVLVMACCLFVCAGSALAEPFARAEYASDLVIREGGVARTIDLPQLKGYRNLKVSCTNDKVTAEIYSAKESVRHLPNLVLRFHYVDSKKNFVTLESGKALVTVTGVKNGVKKTVKLNVVLQKGTSINPFKSFKIGSKELVKKFNKGHWWVTFYGDDKEIDDELVHQPHKMLKKVSEKKLKIKMKPGWKILGIDEKIGKLKGEDGANYKSKAYTLKNGSVLPAVPEADASLRVDVTLNVRVMNTATKLQEEYRITIS